MFSSAWCGRVVSAFPRLCVRISRLPETDRVTTIQILTFLSKSSEDESHPGGECWVWLGHFHPPMTLIRGHRSGLEVRMTPIALAWLISGAIWLLWAALKLSAWCVDNEVSELCTVWMMLLTRPVVWHAGDPDRRIFYHLCFEHSGTSPECLKWVHQLGIRVNINDATGKRQEINPWAGSRLRRLDTL